MVVLVPPGTAQLDSIGITCRYDRPLRPRSGTECYNEERTPPTDELRTGGGESGLEGRVGEEVTL